MGFWYHNAGCGFPKKKFLNEWVFGIPTLVAGLKIYNKMFSVSLFDRVKLCVVTLNDKHWTRANEVCKALKYNKLLITTLKSITNDRFPCCGELSRFDQDFKKR